MPRVISNGEVRIWFAPTIADTTAPTVAEITAGTDITPFLSSLDTPLDGNAPDASDLSSAFNKTVAGKFGGNVSGQMYRDDTTDAAFDAFPRGTTGYLVIRRFGGSETDATIGDEVDVWHVRVITRSDVALDDESVQMFTIDLAALDEPDIDVAVA